MTNHGLWLALMLSLVSMPVIYVLRNVFGWISDDVAMCQMASEMCIRDRARWRAEC